MRNLQTDLFFLGIYHLIPFLVRASIGFRNWCGIYNHLTFHIHIGRHHFQGLVVVGRDGNRGVVLAPSSHTVHASAASARILHGSAHIDERGAGQQRQQVEVTNEEVKEDEDGRDEDHVACEREGLPHGQGNGGAIGSVFSTGVQIGVVRAVVTAEDTLRPGLEGILEVIVIQETQSVGDNVRNEDQSGEEDNHDVWVALAFDCVQQVVFRMAIRRRNEEFGNPATKESQVCNDIGDEDW